jgi:hypothetical protein
VTAPIERSDPAPHANPVRPVPSLPTASAAGPVAAVAPVVPQQPAVPIGVVAQVVAAAVQGVTWAVRPEAAIGVADEFSFPIALTLSVVAYLVIQGRIDRRDPKLRLAPLHAAETVVRFEQEAEL